MSTPDEIKLYVRSIANNYDESEVLTRGQQGGIIGALDRAFGSDALRRRFLAWLFLDDESREMSTKTLTPAQWIALWKWIDFFEEDGRWYKSADFLVEAEICAAYLRSSLHA